MTITTDSILTETVVESNRRNRAELADLGERIAEGAGHLAAATSAWLVLVAEFDRRNGWAHSGIMSCAHWMSWRCGLSPGTAREHVRVARALEGLPKLAAEFAAGRLSYSKMRAVTRVANQFNEDGLVNAALCSTGAQLERIVGGMRKAKDLADVRDRHEKRSLSWRWDNDGMLVVKGRLSPEDGALLLTALEAARSEVCAETHDVAKDSPAQHAPQPEAECCEIVRTPANLNADSLVALSRSALAHLATTDPSSAPDHTVNIHVDLEDLLAHDTADETADDSEPAKAGPRIENGPPIHPETLRRIVCDSAAVIVAHHRSGLPGTSMDIGRRSRTVPRRLRRALVLRDGHCRAPGCTNARYLHAHHVVHWLYGGPTELWNLILLCPAHHHLMHEGGFRVEADGSGGFTFYTAENEAIESPAPCGGHATAVQAMHDATVHSRTATPNWKGETLDLHYAVSVLLMAEEYAARRFHDVPAGTPDLPQGPSLN